jgi:hypothetical protein
VTTSMLKGGRTVSRYTWRFAITEFCHFLLLRYRLSLSILKKESFSLAEMLASRIPGYFICKWRTGRETSSMETDKWESIQYYGNYLEKTAHTLQYTDFHMEPASVQPITIPKKRTLDSPFLFEWFSWRNFRFDTEFAQLAPLITREIRLYAPQAAKLSDWILDWGNVWMAGSGTSRRSSTTYRRNATTKRNNRTHCTSTRDTLQPELDRTPERAQSSFARYISQEAPLEFAMTECGGREPSPSSDTGGGEEDTRSVVSKENHWRRTIFG